MNRMSCIATRALWWTAGRLSIMLGGFDSVDNDF
jgi:hypothetical protein